MLKTVFIMILAGCGDAGGPCEVLDRVEVHAHSIAVCETRLEERMAEMTDEWPEYAGLCANASLDMALPEGWVVPPVLLASGG